MLIEEIERDRFPLEDRTTGHLYLVAEPLTAAPQMAASLTHEGNHSDLYALFGRAEQKLSRDLRGAVPNLPYVRTYAVRGSGAAYSSFEIGRFPRRESRTSRCSTSRSATTAASESPSAD